MVYELKKNTKEIIYKNRKEISEGCTTDAPEPEVINSFEKKDDALRELKNFKSEVQRLSGPAGTYFSVTEYCVEENEYDEDGEWIGGGDIWEISKLPFFEIEK